jgi:nicotinamidase-related amidase
VNGETLVVVPPTYMRSIAMSEFASVARREDAILIVVDVQQRLAAAMERRDSVAASVVRLVKTAALVGVPIVVTRQYPEGLGDTDPTVARAIEAVEGDGHTVSHADKLAFDCFADTDFGQILAASGRSQLLLAGMETHICIAQTALHALRSGLEIQVAADACCSRDAEAHAVALDRLRAAGAAVSSAESIMYELVGAAGTDEFRSLLRIVKE